MNIDELLMETFNPYKTTCEQYLSEHLQKILKFKHRMKSSKTSTFYRGYWTNMVLLIEQIMRFDGDTLEYVKTLHDQFTNPDYVKKIFIAAHDYNRGIYSASMEVFESILNINRDECEKTFSLIDMMD